VAFGLEQSVRLARRLLKFEGKWENAALILLSVLLAVTSVRFYFVEFTPTRRYGSANGETATMMGHYLRELDGDYQAHLLAAPRFYWKFGSMAFLAPGLPGRDILEPLAAPPDLALEGSGQRGTVFVLLPERREELVWIRQTFPDGRLREFHDPLGRLRFLAYEVAP